MNELHAIESVAPLITDGDLPNFSEVEIHPLYERKKWCVKRGKHQANYPMGRGRAGYWDVSNEQVWDAMIPGLKLASQILDNANSWPW